MVKRYIRLLALILAALLLFNGCSMVMDAITGQLELPEEMLGAGPSMVRFADMEYIRPDMAEHDAVLAESCRLAAEGENVEAVVEGVYAYYDVYDRIYTSYCLADIHYSADLTDIYWESEYNYCAQNMAAVDAGLEKLFRALAKSPYLEELEGEDYFGAGFFNSYQGESLWDEEFLALMEQEAELESRYYTLSNEALEVEYYSEAYFSVYGVQMEELFVELVALRQQIARKAGYESYPEFAYDMYHYRDFTPAEAQTYLEEVGSVLVPLYRREVGEYVGEDSYEYCPETATFGYVKTAAKNMGGAIYEAFCLMEDAQLYDISYGENKYNSAFTTYLWSYYEPFVFMSPYLDQSDKRTFAHEFGHFVNNYICWGNSAGTDVAEVHSQGMEYMSLLYGEADGDLVNYKLLDCLSTYVEQAAYALFELQVYALPPEELTVENVRGIYQQIGDQYGFDCWDYDVRDYVSITHFFTEPMYIVSYVVSNDVAFQLYQLEKQETGAGLEIYNACLESTDSYIIHFAENYGLESPFAQGRLELVKKTLEDGLT